MMMCWQFSPKVVQLQKQQEGKLTLLDQSFGLQSEGQLCSKLSGLLRFLLGIGFLCQTYLI